MRSFWLKKKTAMLLHAFSMMKIKQNMSDFNAFYENNWRLLWQWWLDTWRWFINNTFFSISVFFRSAHSLFAALLLIPHCCDVLRIYFQHQIIVVLHNSRCYEFLTRKIYKNICIHLKMKEENNLKPNTYATTATTLIVLTKYFLFNMTNINHLKSDI